VNNAGCSWGAPAEDYPDDGWNKVMSLNVDAQFFLCREVGKHSMLPRKSGKIINIASIAGLYGNPPDWGLQTIAYNTSKGRAHQPDPRARGRVGPVQHQCQRDLPGLLSRRRCPR
jgi:gluconate 5-dehydrogenase